MKTYYTKGNEVKGQEIESIMTLLKYDYPRLELSLSGLLKHVENGGIPLGLSAYNDLNEVPFTLQELNGYIQSLGINVTVKKQ
ncbi:MAG: hypothetical protein GY827_11010 [Cytophagales bacterium]|nr:hypothetical protein [Cytophagales bacterium]